MPLPIRLNRRHDAGCGSSVVEHTLGKGEVESSILSHSTIPETCNINGLASGWRLSCCDDLEKGPAATGRTLRADLGADRLPDRNPDLSPRVMATPLPRVQPTLAQQQQLLPERQQGIAHGPVNLCVSRDPVNSVTGPMPVQTKVGASARQTKVGTSTRSGQNRLGK